MILAYEAMDTAGQRTADTIEAADVKEAVEQLRRRGLYVSRITETTAARSAGSLRPRRHDATGKGTSWGTDPNRRAPVSALDFSKPGASQDGRLVRDQGAAEAHVVDSGGPSPAAKLRLPLKILVLFTRQMAMLLRSGSSVVPAVSAIMRQMKKPPHAKLLHTITDDLEQGLTLTEALRKHPDTFDPVYCAVVSAGEASARLPEMFERLAPLVSRRRALRNQILGSLAYPVLLVVMSAHIILVLLFFVIPRFNDLFVQLGVDAPTSTKVLLASANLLRTYWPILAALMLLGSAAAVVVLTSVRGRQWLGDVQLLLPVVGRLRSTLIQAQILRTMGTLIESGVSVLDTFEMARQSTVSRRYRKLFDDLEQAITSGGTLSATLETSGLVDPYICQAIRTGEDCGNLGGALTYAAELLDETNGELISVTMKLVEPVILIGLGLLVGGVAVSLFLPLFDMTSAMR